MPSLESYYGSSLLLVFPPLLGSLIKEERAFLSLSLVRSEKINKFYFSDSFAFCFAHFFDFWITTFPVLPLLTRKKTCAFCAIKFSVFYLLAWVGSARERRASTNVHIKCVFLFAWSLNEIKNPISSEKNSYGVIYSELLAFFVSNNLQCYQQETKAKMKPRVRRF